MIVNLGFVCFFMVALFIAFSPNASAQEKYHYRAYLQDAGQSRMIPVANIEFEGSSSELNYRLTMNEQQFGDYFLSMRPFKCMTDKVDMLCHLAYPYPLKRQITEHSLLPLEYDFLFIRRKPADYGINPWNGLYYRLQKKGDEYVGIAHEVDLDILAVPPPEDDPFPIKSSDLHETDTQQLWLPRLLIKPEI